MQDHFALHTIQLRGLCLEETREGGVAPVRERAVRDDVGLEAGGGVSEAAADDAPELLLRDALVEGCPLERTQLGPNTDGLEIADHGFPCVGGGHVTKILE